MAGFFPAPEVDEDDEPDLDWGEDDLDPTLEKDAPRSGLPLATSMPPGSGRTPWGPIAEHLARHREMKGIGEDGKKVGRKRVESEPQPITVLEAGREVSIDKLPMAPKGIARRAEGATWEVHAVVSSAHHAATLFQDDSKDDDKQQHSRGDVRYPAEDRVHSTVYGGLTTAGQLVASFRAYYITRPAKTKSGMATTFESADFYDPITGRDFTMVAGVFSDWFDVFVRPAAARAPRKTLEEKRDAKLALPIESGEWNG